MTLNDSYLHAICSHEIRFEPELTLEVLESIMKSGYILSRRKLGYTANYLACGWNGLDYISLCDYSKRNEEPKDKKLAGYTAYKRWIGESLSIILDKSKIKAITPEMHIPPWSSSDSIQTMYQLGNHPTKRFTDLPDEVQVKNKISISHMKGLLLPTNYIKEHSELSEQGIIDFVNDIRKVILSYYKDTPIYDYLTEEEIKTDDDIEKILSLKH